MPDVQPSTGNMPSRSSSSAPKFDGLSHSLKRFLDEVHDLGVGNNVSDKKTIKAALSYISLADYATWSALDAASGDNWTAFTAAVYAMYPGAASTDRQYTRTDLNQLLERTQRIPMDDLDNFGHYYRSFLAITSFLKKQGRIGDAQQSDWFVEGLPQPLRDELHRYLCAKEPDHHADDPWLLTSLYDAVIFVLGNRCTSSPRSQIIHQDTRVAANTSLKSTPSRIDEYLHSDKFVEKMSALMMNVSANPPDQHLAFEDIRDIHDEIDQLEASVFAAQARLDVLLAGGT